MKNQIKLISVLGLEGYGKQGRTKRMALYLCPSCASEFKASHDQRKKIQTCSKCSNNGKNKTHGLYKDDCYQFWLNMRQRVYGKTERGIRCYVERGVTICDEWDDVRNFKVWFDENYIEGYELDKDIKSKELGIEPPIYSPSTCAFVTKSENNYCRRVL